ncbi:MAG: hypothetical protein WD928_05425 [Gammaproteobacteria bacterium]
MTAKKTPAMEIPQQFTDSTNAYIERLMKSHERFAAALEATRARNARLSDKFFETMMANQREALSFGKTLASEPTAYGKNMEAAMQSMTAAQERALDFAKTLYREQAEASSEIRDAATETFEEVKKIVPPMEKLTSMWNSASK